jgi:hypothetical protein
MADWSITGIDQIQAPGGNIPCNGNATDSWYLDPSRSILPANEIRAQVDDRGQDHGYLFPGVFLKTGVQVTLHMIAHVLSSGTDPGWATARDSLIDTTKSRLETMLASTGTLHWASGYSIGGLRARSIGPPVEESSIGPGWKSMLVVLVGTSPV